MATFHIKYGPFGDRFDVSLDGEHVYRADHDRDGWIGMENIETTIYRIAALLGAEITKENEE